MGHMVGCWEVSHVPAFRHFSYSNTKLADSGNTMLKCHTQLWLSEVAWDDMSTMLTQIKEFHSFIAGELPQVEKDPAP